MAATSSHQHFQSVPKEAVMDFWDTFHGPNAGYVLEMYERYRRDPGSVDDVTRRFVESLQPPADGNGAAPVPVAAAPGRFISPE